MADVRHRVGIRGSLGDIFAAQLPSRLVGDECLGYA